MIRLLVRLGKWLDSRFPAKVVVLESDYRELRERMSGMESQMLALRKEAVHKDAVKDLVLVVKSVKEDFQSLKTSLGFNARQVNPELSAVLNGEYLGDQNERV